MNKSIKKQGGRCWPAAAMLLLLLAALVLPSYVAAQTGQISGTVKDNSGAPLQDVEVYVYDAEDTSGLPPAPELTNENGWYEVSFLPFGEHRYKVQFIGNGYIEQWYKDAPMSDCAEPVTITAENTVQDEIDAVLKEGTSSAARRSLAKISPAAAETGSVISGNVTLNGTAFKCAKVEAYNAADDFDWIDQVFTDYQGNYTINDLDPGSYKILFYDQNGDAGQWYNRKADAACADAVSETASGINAAFPVSLQQCGDRPTILPAIKLLLN